MTACPETGHVTRNTLRYTTEAPDLTTAVVMVRAYLEAAGCTNCDPCAAAALRALLTKDTP